MFRACSLGRSLKSGSLKRDFKQFGVTFWRIPMIIKYIKDMIFYDLKNVPFLRHLFSEINNWKRHLGKLEEGSVSPYFPSMMLGGKNSISL
jgi:hypothetical protein